MPYRSDDLDKAFHIDAMERFEGERLKPRTRRSPDAIRDIAVVGGLIDWKGHLYEGDQDRLVNILIKMNKAGIPLHPDCKVWVYNFGLCSDFLTAAQGQEFEGKKIHPDKMDLVFCSMIADRDIGIVFDPEDPKINECELHRVAPRTISNYQTKPKDWALSAEALGARFVATYGNYNDITDTHFEGDDHFAHVTNRQGLPENGMICATRFFVHRSILPQLPQIITAHEIEDPSAFRIC